MDKHGNLNLIWEGDILIIELKGPFNEEGITYWITEIKNEVKTKGFARWKRLEIWDDNAFGSPKTNELAKSIFDWYESNGCYKSAAVVSYKRQAKILKEQFNSSSRVFTNQPEALDWLASE